MITLLAYLNVEAYISLHLVIGKEFKAKYYPLVRRTPRIH